jgi:Domain of unknown function (DUF397)
MADGSSGELVWHRGRWCESGACVEIAAVGDAVMVRSSANAGGTPVTLSRDEWREFLAGAKEGAFDHL